MNILILTKLKPQILKANHTSVEDYIEEDHFFDGYARGFKKLGHNIFLNWEESFFISQKFRLKFDLLSRILKFIFRKTRFDRIDRYLFSRKISKFCKENNIDFIFTEINSFISPLVIKKYFPKVLVTQWYGIFPEMSSRDTLNILSEYDYIWGPCEFYRNKVNFKGIEKLHYIGCSVNHTQYFYDYDENLAYDIIFVGGVGNAHSNRIDLLEKIAKKYDDFAFYGYGIENIPENYKLKEKYKGWASTNELRKLFSSSKVAINLTLNDYEKVKRGFNARLFEIAACGGSMQLCKSDQKINEFFKIGSDLDVFDDEEEMIAKIDYYLNHREERIVLAQNAVQKISRYTYYNRAKIIINIIMEKI